jgi:MoxR-like ATPase
MSAHGHNWWEVLGALFKAVPFLRIMLIGPPGTGKSTTAVLEGKGAKRDVYRITLTEGAGIEDLLGMYHLVDGETKWVDGPAVRALKTGSLLLLDEIDRHSPEVMSLLYALLDDDPQVTLPSGEEVTAAKGYGVIATSNNAVSALPDAILDRFEAVLIANKPHPDAMKHLSQAAQAAVRNYYASVSLTTWKWKANPTLRRMRAFQKFSPHHDEAVIAGAVFGESGAEILSVLVTAGLGKE